MRACEVLEVFERNLQSHEISLEGRQTLPGSSSYSWGRGGFCLTSCRKAGSASKPRRPSGVGEVEATAA